jgi:hemolysin activation/secretion protein
LYALPEWLGNLDSYNKIKTNFNYYVSPGRNKILASRFAIYRAVGSVPFSGQQVIGGTDIRGYSKGAYRGNETYSMQSELRWTLFKRFGVVGFAGLALANDADDKLSPLLPGIGGGLRYLLIKAQRINMGIDAAVGKGDYGIYFRLGEAF